jgi:hypothetical protein
MRIIEIYLEYVPNTEIMFHRERLMHEISAVIIGDMFRARIGKTIKKTMKFGAY